jgi:very-short-patch-repair endonuclease
VWVLGVRNTIRVSGTPDQRMAAVTRRQRGRIKRAQLRILGLSDEQIEDRVLKGRLRREHPSVYVDALMPEIPLGAETGALLSIARPLAVLSHHTAAALWSFGAPDHDIHLLVPGGWTRPRAGVRVHRTRLLPAADVRQREGLPVTSPARTLVDCATAGAGARQLERMFTEALTLRLVTPAALAAAARNCPAIIRLLDAEIAPAVLRSDTERRLLELLRRARLPQPHTNAALRGFEADLYWPEQRLVVEVDGSGFHTGRWATERDRRKEAAFRAHGIDTMRFSRAQIHDDELTVVAQIARRLG